MHMVKSDAGNIDVFELADTGNLIALGNFTV